MTYGKRITWLEERKKSKTVCTNKENRIVLFDMDGTLTPPRQSFDTNLLQPLRELSQHTQIGIVTGSDVKYVNQQMEYVLKKSELVYCLHLLPCNGTKWYPPPRQLDDWYDIKHNADMRETLGEEKYRHLVAILLDLQCHVSALGIPLTGEFIQYRGSMINWCPIGRAAKSKDREQFVLKDEKLSIRKNYLKRLERKLSLNGIQKDIACTLGGDTSFDIYPIGWDKTYALRHFEDYDVWFVGDRCGENGNDKQIYDALYSKGRSYKTTGIEKTKEIIKALVGHFASLENTDG